MEESIEKGLFFYNKLWKRSLFFDVKMSAGRSAGVIKGTGVRYEKEEPPINSLKEKFLGERVCGHDSGKISSRA